MACVGFGIACVCFGIACVCFGIACVVPGGGGGGGRGMACVTGRGCSRGNGPASVSTGTGPRWLAAPGITGSGRATCDGAIGRAAFGVGIDGKPGDGIAGMPVAGVRIVGIAVVGMTSLFGGTGMRGSRTVGIAVVAITPTLGWQAGHDWAYTRMGAVVRAEWPGGAEFALVGLFGAGLLIGLPLLVTGAAWYGLRSVLWQALREDPASVAQTVMAANAPMLLQRSMVEGNPAEGVMSAGQVAALIGQLDSCQDVIHGIVAQARQRYQQLAPSLS